jgi:chromosomal replication initiation ATPase DnaA
MTLQRDANPVADIVDDVVVEAFGITLDEIHAPATRVYVMAARQVACSLSRRYSDLSYPALARRYGWTAHTTALSACRATDRNAERHPTYAAIRRSLCDRIEWRLDERGHTPGTQSLALVHERLLERRSA